MSREESRVLNACFDTCVVGRRSVRKGISLPALWEGAVCVRAFRPLRGELVKERNKEKT